MMLHDDARVMGWTLEACCFYGWYDWHYYAVLGEWR